MSPYSHSTYKEFFLAYINENQQRGIVAKVATDCGCDRTYISQVLYGKADLKPDHVIQFCEVNSFKETDSQYLLWMLLRDRAATPLVRKTLNLKMEALKKINMSLSRKIMKEENPNEVTEEMRSKYYSSWVYCAVHILTSIPQFQSAKAIADKLQIPLSGAIAILTELAGMGLVKKEKEKYVHASGNFYLDRKSPHSNTNHLHWRLKAVERALFVEDVHYTNVFSLSEKDVEKLRRDIIQLIESQRKQVQASGTEVAYAFCCDFFAI